LEAEAGCLLDKVEGREGIGGVEDR
jgi:hypothetical protein